jgi:hypothetical protein
VDPFLYADAGVEVRSDLIAAHRRAWQALARPGAWWSGAERVAIADELRHAATCRLCAARKAAVTPSAVSGEHDSPGRLPAPAVEVVHRVTSDPARLSRTWFEKTQAEGLSDAHYVELVGVLVVVVSIDAFHKALGVPLEPLPAPEPGEPTQQRPAGAALESAWVPMLRPDRLGEAERDIYGGAPFTGNVIRALSLVPDAVRALRDMSAAQYIPIERMSEMETGRAIDRAQMELVAGRVSALNECFY